MSDKGLPQSSSSWIPGSVDLVRIFRAQSRVLPPNAQTILGQGRAPGTMTRKKETRDGDDGDEGGDDGWDSDMGPFGPDAGPGSPWDVNVVGGGGGWFPPTSYRDIHAHPSQPGITMTKRSQIQYPSDFKGSFYRSSKSLNIASNMKKADFVFEKKDAKIHYWSTTASEVGNGNSCYIETASLIRSVVSGVVLKML